MTLVQWLHTVHPNFLEQGATRSFACTSIKHPKGDDSITVPNFARVLVLSNKKSAIPIEPTERRFTVFFAPHKTRAEMLNAVDKNGGDSTTHFDDLHASVAYGSPVRQ
jgi:hypothetical protein